MTSASISKPNENTILISNVVGKQADQINYNVMLSPFLVDVPERYDKYKEQEFTLPYASEVCHTIVPCSDSNSLLCCLAAAFDSLYLLGSNKDVSIDKKQAIKNLRLYAAKQLELQYDSLNNGNLIQLITEQPKWSLSNMVSLLQSDDFLTEDVIEIFSNIIKCDVYIIDYQTKRVKSTNTGYGFIIKGIRTVVLLQMDHLYHLVYVIRDDTGQLFFSPSDPFITELRNSMTDILK